jgi:cytochrome P450
MRSEIQAVVDNLLDDLCQRGEMDIIADFIAPLASLTISKIIGLPVEDYNKLINWSSDSIVVFEHPMSLENYQKRNQIVIENKQYFLDKIAEYKQYSNNGLISYLINQKGNESLLTDDEIASICIMLSDTAQDSMKGLIGNGMFALLNDPQSLEYLKQNPDEIKNAVEEFLRYDSPIQFAARMAIENVDIAGKSICQGDKVLVYLGAANRDPEIFPDPNQLNFNRHIRSLAFGGGIHHCLGQFLGKLEAQVAINALIQRLPNISLNTQHISHYKSIMLRRLISLPIKFNSSLS